MSAVPLVTDNSFTARSICEVSYLCQRCGLGTYTLARGGNRARRKGRTYSQRTGLNRGL